MLPVLLKKTAIKCLVPQSLANTTSNSYAFMTEKDLELTDPIMFYF